MHQGKLVFSQLMAHLPLSTFRRCAAKHRGDHKVHDFSCLDQFFAMAFAQLTYRESLRDIEISLRAQSKRLYHMGFRCQTISRNTLANANATLNEHVHFHVCVVDGVFEALAGGADAGADTDTQPVVDGQSSPSKVILHPASGIDETAVAQVQATLRARILRAFVGSGTQGPAEPRVRSPVSHIFTRNSGRGQAEGQVLNSYFFSAKS